MLVAAGAIGIGLLGAYSYAQTYSQHRGFGTIRRLPRARSGRLVTVHFYSRALHRRTDYLVYLPPGYTRARRYPVYYLLHGAPGAPQAFISVAGLDVRLINRLSENRLAPMLLVFADGRVHGDTFSDSEWANTPSGAFENYVIDVVRDVDHRFTTIRSRDARVIGGYSAGAYGALNIALHHLPIFANVQSWSGYFTQTHDGVFAHASPATMLYNSPLAFARMPSVHRAIALHPLRAYMFIGRADPARPQIRPMTRELRRDGARASYNVFPGGHDWQVWYARVDPMMILASDWISHPLPPPSIRARRTAGVPTTPPPAALTTSLLTPVHARHHNTRLTPGRFTLEIGLILAVVSAALINLGFLLQHRGLADRATQGEPMLIAALRSRVWLAGQALGWVGFATQIIAVVLAPLSLVQAFAAGGLAVSVPLAAGIFHYRVSRRQLAAVAIMTLSLAVLPLGIRAPAIQSATGAMMAVAVVFGAIAGAVAVRWSNAAGRAVLAGVLYGIADAAIKADAAGARMHGSTPLLSGWTLLALLGTFGGFLAFQAALRHGNAVAAISLMTAMAALTALAFGLVAFGESLGRSAVASVTHLCAIGCVLACVPVLAAAQQDAGGRAARQPLSSYRARCARAGTVIAMTVATVLGLVVAVFSATGLLYGLRGLGWFPAGPKIPNALPLLQLAGFDVQPLPRVVVAWILAGVAFGVLFGRIRPLQRGGIAAMLALALLLFASDASLALARNLRLTDVLGTTIPGIGAWLEAALFALGAALPGSRGLRMPRVVWRVIRTNPLLSGRTS